MAEASFTSPTLSRVALKEGGMRQSAGMHLFIESMPTGHTGDYWLEARMGMRPGRPTGSQIAHTAGCAVQHGIDWYCSVFLMNAEGRERQRLP